MNKIKLEDLKRLDKQDPLSIYREEFFLPKNTIYFDGNSLGPVPTKSIKNLNKTINEEWGEGLINSWNKANWINLPQTLGDKIAPLLGARSDGPNQGSPANRNNYYMVELSEIELKFQLDLIKLDLKYS